MNSGGTLRLRGDSVLEMENRGRDLRLVRGGLALARDDRSRWVESVSSGGATVYLLGTDLTMHVGEGGGIDFALRRGRVAVRGVVGFAQELTCEGGVERLRSGDGRFRTECYGDGRALAPRGGTLRVSHSGYTVTLTSGTEAMEVSLRPQARFDATELGDGDFATVILWETPTRGRATLSGEGIWIVEDDEETGLRSVLVERGRALLEEAGLPPQWFRPNMRTIVLDEAVPERVATVYAAEGYFGFAHLASVAEGYDLTKASHDSSFAYDSALRAFRVLEGNPIGDEVRTAAVTADVVCTRERDFCEGLRTTLTVFLIPVSDPGQVLSTTSYHRDLSFRHTVHLPTVYHSLGEVRSSLSGFASEQFRILRASLLATEGPDAGRYELTLSHFGGVMLGTSALSVSFEISPATITDAGWTGESGVTAVAAPGYSGELFRAGLTGEGVAVADLPESPPGFEYTLTPDEREVAVALSPPLLAGETRELRATLLARRDANHADLRRVVGVRIEALAPAEAALYSGIAYYEDERVHDFKVGGLAGASFSLAGSAVSLRLSADGVVSTEGELGPGVYALTAEAASPDFLGAAFATMTLTVTLHSGEAHLQFDEADLNRFFPSRVFNATVHPLARVPLLTISASAGSHRRLTPDGEVVVANATLSFLGWTEDDNREGLSFSELESGRSFVVWSEPPALNGEGVEGMTGEYYAVDSGGVYRQYDASQNGLFPATPPGVCADTGRTLDYAGEVFGVSLCPPAYRAGLAGIALSHPYYESAAVSHGGSATIAAGVATLNVRVALDALRFDLDAALPPRARVYPSKTAPGYGGQDEPVVAWESWGGAVYLFSDLPAGFGVATLAGGDFYRDVAYPPSHLSGDRDGRIYYVYVREDAALAAGGALSGELTAAVRFGGAIAGGITVGVTLSAVDDFESPTVSLSLKRAALRAGRTGLRFDYGDALVDAFGEDARDARVSLSAKLDGVDTTEIFRLRDNGFDLVLPPGTVAAQDVLNARYGGTHAVEISARDRDAFLGEYRMSVFAALDAAEDEGVSSTVRATVYIASGYEGKLWGRYDFGGNIYHVPSDTPGRYPVGFVGSGVHLDDYFLAEGIGQVVEFRTVRPYVLAPARPDAGGHMILRLTASLLALSDDDVRNVDFELEVGYVAPQLHYTSDSYPHLTAGDSSVGEVLARLQTPSIVAEWLSPSATYFSAVPGNSLRLSVEGDGRVIGLGVLPFGTHDFYAQESVSGLDGEVSHILRASIAPPRGRESELLVAAALAGNAREARDLLLFGAEVDDVAGSGEGAAHAVMRGFGLDASLRAERVSVVALLDDAGADWGLLNGGGLGPAHVALSVAAHSGSLFAIENGLASLRVSDFDSGLDSEGRLPLEYGLAEWGEAAGSLRSGWGAAVAAYLTLIAPGDSCAAVADAAACLVGRRGKLREYILTDNQAAFDAADKSGRVLREVDGEGLSPLHHAATVFNGHYLAELLFSGADVNLKSPLGFSPVHFAVSLRSALRTTLMAHGFSRSSGFVSTNYDAGAALAQVDEVGYAPLDYAGRLRSEATNTIALEEFGEIILILRDESHRCAEHSDDDAFVRCVSDAEGDYERRALWLTREDNAGGLGRLADEVRSASSLTTAARFTLYRTVGDGNLLHHSVRHRATLALAYLLTMTGLEGGALATVLFGGASLQINFRNDDDAAPLHHAVEHYGDELPEIAGALLDAGADGRAIMTRGSLAQTALDLALTLYGEALAGGDDSGAAVLARAVILMNGLIEDGCTESGESSVYAACVLPDALRQVPESESIPLAERRDVENVAGGYVGPLAVFRAANPRVTLRIDSSSEGFAIAPGTYVEGDGVTIYLIAPPSPGGLRTAELTVTAMLEPFQDAEISLRVVARGLLNPVAEVMATVYHRGTVFDFGGEGYAEGAYAGASFFAEAGSDGEFSVSRSGVVSVVVDGGLAAGDYEVRARATGAGFLGVARLTLAVVAAGRAVDVDAALPVRAATITAAADFAGTGWTLTVGAGHDLRFGARNAGYAAVDLGGGEWGVSLTRPLGEGELVARLTAEIYCPLGECADGTGATLTATFRPVAAPRQDVLRGTFGESASVALRLPVGYESGGTLRVVGVEGGAVDWFSVSEEGFVYSSAGSAIARGYVVTAGLRHSGFLGELALAVSATIGRATLAAGLGIPDGDLTPAAVTVVFGHAGEVWRATLHSPLLFFGRLPDDVLGMTLSREGEVAVFSLAEALESGGVLETSATLSARRGGNYGELSQELSLRITSLREPPVRRAFGEARGTVLYESGRVFDFASGDYFDSRFEMLGDSFALEVEGDGVAATRVPLGAGEYGVTVLARNDYHAGTARLTLTLLVTTGLISDSDSVAVHARTLSRLVAAEYSGAVGVFVAGHSEVSLRAPLDSPVGFALAAGDVFAPPEGVTLFVETLQGGEFATARFAVAALRPGFAETTLFLNATVRAAANPPLEISRRTRAGGDVFTLTASWAVGATLDSAGADSPLRWVGNVLRADASLALGRSYRATARVYGSGFLGTMIITARVQAAAAHFGGAPLTRPYEEISATGNQGATVLAAGVLPETGAGGARDFPMRYHGIRRGLHVLYYPPDEVEATESLDGYYRGICESGAGGGNDAWRLASVSEALGLLREDGVESGEVRLCSESIAAPGLTSGVVLNWAADGESLFGEPAGVLPSAALSDQGYATGLRENYGLQATPSEVCNVDRNVIAGVSGNAGVLCVAEAEGEYAAGHRAAAVGLMLVREDESGTVVTLGTRPGNVVYVDSDSLNYEAPFSGAIYSVTVYAWRYGVGGGVSLERGAAIGAPLVSDLDLTATVDFDSGSPGVARVVLRTHPGGEFDGNRDVVVGFAPQYVGATVSLTIKFRSGAVASWGGTGTEVFGEGDSFATTDGSGRTLTATYHGRRRGLHVMALEGFHSAGTGAEVCPAAANGETGWRLPNFTELAGLYAEGAGVELGEAFGVLELLGRLGRLRGCEGGCGFRWGRGRGTRRR